MKYGFLRVGAISHDIKVADVSYNVGEMKKQIEKWTKEGVELIAFPELSICGYTCEDLFLNSTLLVACEEGLVQLAKATEGKKVIVFVGAPVRKDGKLYNCGVALSGGKILGVVPKTNIPNYGEFFELRYFSPYEGEEDTVRICGEEVPFGCRLLFCDKTNGDAKICCEICEDLWVSDSPSIEHTKAGATVVVNLSASNELIGKAEYRRKLVSTQSTKNDCAYVYVNPGIGESTSDTVYSAHNLIVENGEILAESLPFGEGVAIGEIDLSYLVKERVNTTTYRSEKKKYTKIYADFVGDDELSVRCFTKTPFVPQTEEEKRSEAELVLSVQAQALARRITHIGAKTAVIGISGGLDSALAFLAVCRAFDLCKKDRKDIIAITMPGFGTTGKTYQNAVKLIEEMGATCREISIKKSVEQHFADIGHKIDCYDTTYENAQARMRTLILMDVANQTGGIVIGTGDLSELALGWCTYNGDQMSMYNVNCSIAKTLVKHLVEKEANRLGGEVEKVLLDILHTEISPELLPPDTAGEIAQKTEDLVGPYILHDFFIYHFIARGYSPKKIYYLACRTFEGDFSKEEILKWLRSFYRRFFTQQFKRSASPDGVKVSKICISAKSDWRMPSDATYHLWLDELENL